MKKSWLHHIPAWTAAALALLLLAPAAWARDYTVKKDGTGDYTSIRSCASVLRAGDTCVVYPGTYTERVSFSGISGTSSAKISFRAATRRTAVLQGFDVSNANYVRIEGFEIAPASGQSGIWVRGDYCEIIDNYIHDCQKDAINFISDYGRVADNYIYRTQMGIIASKDNYSTKRTGSNWVVENNEINVLVNYNPTGSNDSDYSRYWGYNGVFRNNYFHGADINNLGNAHVDGFQTWDGDSGNCLIERNRVFGFHQGLMIEDANAGVTVRNNVFVGSAWGVCAYNGVQNITIVHNVFRGMLIGTGIRLGSSGTVKNNIFLECESSYYKEADCTMAASNNIQYNNQSNSTISPGDKVNVNPGFVSMSGNDYRLAAGSPAIDAGTNAGVTNDLLGASRPQGAGYDIGPYEYGSGAPTSTPTPTPTPVITPTPTPVITPTPTPAPTKTPTPTPTPVITPTPTPVITPTPTPAPTKTPTPTPTPVITPTPTPVITPTPTPVITPTPTPAPGGGLVLAYNFNEGTGQRVTDRSGNNNIGYIEGSTWTTAGKFGGAMRFNGYSRVSAGGTASLNITGPVTLEAWVCPTTTMRGWREIIVKENGSDASYFLYANTSYSRPCTGLWTSAETILYGRSALPVNVWTHLAMTYDGNAIRLYINGVLIGARTQTGAVSISPGALRIGGNSIWGEYFTGKIDEIRIYNKALSTTQIQTDMKTAIQ